MNFQWEKEDMNIEKEEKRKNIYVLVMSSGSKVLSLVMHPLDDLS